MPDFSQSAGTAEVQTALQALQRTCMGPDGAFADVDELVITQSTFAGFSHRYGDMRTGDTWTFTTGRHRVPVSELAWLGEFKRSAFRPGFGSWITVRVHVFPDAPGFVEVFDEEIPASGGAGGVASRRVGTAGVLTSELLAFPRTVDHIPQWMWDVFRADGVSPPVYNADLKTVDWDNKRLPVSGTGTDFSVDPVVIDPTKEPGVFSKISKKIFGK